MPCPAAGRRPPRQAATRRYSTTFSMCECRRATCRSPIESWRTMPRLSTLWELGKRKTKIRSVYFTPALQEAGPWHVGAGPHCGQLGCRRKACLLMIYCPLFGPRQAHITFVAKRCAAVAAPVLWQPHVWEGQANSVCRLRRLVHAGLMLTSCWPPASLVTCRCLAYAPSHARWAQLPAVAARAPAAAWRLAIIDENRFAFCISCRRWPALADEYQQVRATTQTFFPPILHQYDRSDYLSALYQQMYPIQGI